MILLVFGGPELLESPGRLRTSGSEVCGKRGSNKKTPVSYIQGVLKPKSCVMKVQPRRERSVLTQKRRFSGPNYRNGYSVRPSPYRLRQKLRLRMDSSAILKTLGDIHPETRHDQTEGVPLIHSPLVW